jgi:hypothetical protein
MNLPGKFGYTRNLVFDDLHLPLSFFKLKVVHFDFFFLLSDELVTIFKDVLMNVGFLIKNTQFVILIDQLDTHVVSGFTSSFIVEDKTVHFFLERVNDEIVLVSFIDLLTDDRDSIFVSEFSLVLISH